MFEFFIAYRYLRSKRRVNLITVISVLSTVGITIGVAALVVMLSVFNGFGGIVTSMLMNFDPNVRITYTSDTPFDVYPEVEEFVKSNQDVNDYYSFVEGKSILFTGTKYEIVELRGVDIHDYERWGVTDMIMSGSSDLGGESIAKIVIGFPQRLKLSKSAGDTILISSFYNIEKTLFSLALPVNAPAEITGIYKSNNRDYDNNLVFTSLLAGQKILGFGSRVSGLDIKLKDSDNSEKMKNLILQSFPEAN